MYKKVMISKEHIENLRNKDNSMRLLIDSIGDIRREYIPDPFIALVNSIVFQQLAYKAAISIWNRFEQFMGEITPEGILAASIESLRTCGLSQTKISYIRNIAEAVERNEIDFNSFTSLSDEEIIEKLVKIKGVGVWTAEMFLIFSLNRKDVMSYHDLGIRKGLKWLYNMKEEPTMKEVEKFKKKFTPHNTLASFYLWEITTSTYLNYENIEQAVFKGPVAYVDSPMGLLELRCEEGEITSLDFVKEKRYDEKLEPVLEEGKRQLEEYFSGKRREFHLPLKINGTEFQNRVWRKLMEIPYGETASYKDMARWIGNENASRAIGNANNKNKIAIMIPCHRVVGSDGKLVGYEGGLWRKEWLLEHEKRFKLGK